MESDFFLVLLICLLGKVMTVAQTSDKLRSIDQIEKPAFFNPDKPLKVNKEKQNVWIRNTVDSLISTKLDENFDILSHHLTELDEYKMISYRVNKSGKLLFHGGEYCIIYVHSAHEDPEIGDVSVALTMDGIIYINFGHVCGGIIHFVHMSTDIPKKPAEFFDVFSSDTDDEKWNRWENK